MRASTTAPLLAALAAGLALGACGGGLYDVEGVPVLEGGGDVCDPEKTISCAGLCTTPNPAQCGAACEDCATKGVTVPEHGVLACRGSGTSSACGYECTDADGVSQGFLRCGAGCCGASALAAGARHTCALLSPSRDVACWGANESGQVTGAATVAPVPAPRLVALPEAATAIAAGPSHTCAVLQGGSVRCWGSDAAGQVSGAAGVANAVEVAVGGAHTCALLGSGAVTCWGSNAAGQLGPGPGAPIGSGATAVAAGRDHTCAVVGGAVRCWGATAALGAAPDPANGIATPIPSGVVLVSASGGHTCAGKPSSGADLDDALRCWGDSFGTSAADVAGWFLEAPQATPAIPRRDPTRATIQNDVTLLAVGEHHVCARFEPVSLDCLGRNEAGQLGGVPEAGRTVPVQLPGTTAVAAGAAHTCAAGSDGRLLCWGDNEHGQLGNGTTVDPGVGVLATPLGR